MGGLEIWEAAKDFLGILELNRRFILGEIPRTPYHCGPLDDETLPFIDGLLRLHDFQLLTDNSQPYVHERSLDSNHQRLEYQQRPCVSFLMLGDNDQAFVFLEMLQSRLEILVWVYDVSTHRVLSLSPSDIAVTRCRFLRVLSV